MKLKDLKLYLECVHQNGLRVGDFDKASGENWWVQIIETKNGKEKILGKAYYKEPIYPSEEEGEKNYEETGEYPRPYDQIVKVAGRKFNLSFVHDGLPMWVYEVDS